MFESKLILKLPPFSLTYTFSEKRRQFQNELTLKHSEVILEIVLALGGRQLSQLLDYRRFKEYHHFFLYLLPFEMLSYLQCNV